MPLEPATIYFRGNEPHRILEIGYDCALDLADRDVRLVAPVIPHVPGQVVIAREEFEAMYEALRFRDAETPSFSWLDALKARVDAQVAA